MKIQPIGSRLIIEPFTVEEVGDLYTPELGKSTPVKVKVLNCNPESGFNIGDTIFIRRYSSDELKYKDSDGSEKTLYVVESEDVVGKLIED